MTHPAPLVPAEVDLRETSDTKDKRPSFQFYPGDWMSDLKLRRCSPAARGVWVDVLCALHDSDDAYGLLRWPLKELARTVGASMAHLRELIDKGVLRGSDTEITEPLVYVPRSGRKPGPPVILVPAQAGPVWYSKRLVKDEYVRTHRGEGSRFGADSGGSPKAAPKGGNGEGQSDGSSTSSPSSASLGHTEDSERAGHATPEVNLEGQQPTPAGRICRAMRQQGQLQQTNPGDPRFLALIAQGATEAEFVGLATEAVAKGKGWAWVLAVLQARRADAAAIALAPPVAPPSPTVASNAADDTQRYLAEQASHQRSAPPADLLAKVRKAVKVNP